MKKVCLSLLMGLMVQMTFGQTLEKMQWFNEPEQWEIKNNVLSMSVTPQSDYWRISHYGFTVDDAPFYYATYIIGKTNRTNIKNKSYKFHVCQFETSALFVLLLSETFCTFAILGI